MAEKRQQERRQHRGNWWIAPGAALPGSFAGREVVTKSVAELVVEIRAAAPEISLERAEAIAIGIRRDCGDGRSKIRR